MSQDIVALARRHKHIASHYEGCEADHVGCLVHRLADEIEGLRAQLEDHYVSMRVRQLEHALDAERQTARWRRAEIERLRAALSECACACSSIRECESEWAKDNYCLHLNARKALEGKP